MKTCTKCKVEKPKTEFSNRYASNDGLSQSCKSCVSEYCKLRYSSNKEFYKTKSAAWKKENPERRSEANKMWYRENIDRHSKTMIDFHLNNPIARSVYSRNRRSRHGLAEGKHTSSDINAIFSSQRGLCATCQIKLVKSGKNKYHVDHIMPLKLGGSNWPNNLQCLCPSCNMSKSAKHPLDWAKENGKLL